MKKGLFYLFMLLAALCSITPVQAETKKSDPIPTSSILDFTNLVLKIDDQKEAVAPEQFNEWISVEPSLKKGSERRSEVENINYCPVSPLYCRIFSSIKEMAYLKKETGISAKKEAIQSFLENLAQKIDRDPVDAKFKLENDKIATFIDSQPGIKIDIDKSIQIISDEILKTDAEQSKEIELAYAKTDPKVQPSDVNNLGINTLIGEGTSNFRGSPRNRILNIKVATSRFNGVLIKPGEEFSFVNVLGPVDGEHGYAPELVIKQDKTEPEFGGGVCQVSTTAFRAAIYSGLEITARRNHAYPVSYYNPQGMDATVYIPKPDLKFINNTPGYILIQTKIEGTVLTFQFFGTDDGRKVEVNGPKIISKESDGSMKTTFTQKVTDKDGNVTINDTFNSSYDSPDKYPHPGSLTTKPKDWSNKQWEEYLRASR